MRVWSSGDTKTKRSHQLHHRPGNASRIAGTHRKFMGLALQAPDNLAWQGWDSEMASLTWGERLTSPTVYGIL